MSGQVLVRSKSMPRKLRMFTERGPLIALAIAAGMLLGIVGPTSAQFSQFRRISAAAAATTRWRRALAAAGLVVTDGSAVPAAGAPAAAANTTARARDFSGGAAA